MRVDYYSFLQELRMYYKPTVLVEGLNDVNLIKSLFNAGDTDSDRINVLSPKIRGNNNKKQIIIKVLEHIFNNFPYRRRINYIGIVDSDFNRICKNMKRLNNLFYTDKHDFDAQIFSSNAFKKFLQHFFQEPSNLNMDEIRDSCLELAKEFGYFLLALYKIGNHQLKELLRPIENHIDSNHNKYILKVNKIKNILKNLSEKEQKEIERLITLYKRRNIDPYLIANGHDLVRVLAKLILFRAFNLIMKGLDDDLIKRYLNNERDKLKFIAELENKLRVCYEFQFFSETELYEKIISYQNRFGVEFIKKLNK